MAWDIKGKNVLITGGNTGIGFETALELCRRGARVGITSRDAKKGEAAVAEIKRAHSTAEIECFSLDLANLASVRACADEVLRRLRPLSVLINNAGLVLSDRRETVDGFEMTFGVNHLGHFYLTELLLPELRAAAPARIINVSSAAHRMARGLNFEDLHAQKGYQGFPVYAASKLANILFTRELARRVEASQITVNALHPGVVRSGFAADGDMRGIASWFWALGRPFMLSSRQGAATTIYLATSDEVSGVSGSYFAKCRPAKPTRFALDDDAARRLWETSASLIAARLPADARAANA
jgi:NAD(P)-dependent dehydrogenase (short-subunit alcohol dehydrogenase family)